MGPLSRFRPQERAPRGKEKNIIFTTRLDLNGGFIAEAGSKAEGGELIGRRAVHRQRKLKRKRKYRIRFLSEQEIMFVNYLEYYNQQISFSASNT